MRLTVLPWHPPSTFEYRDNGSAPPNQQQQQPQPQQNQPQQGQQGQSQQAGPSQAAQFPPTTLSSVLHFLQTEHRRYARDRNEWEIERAEMRARIALLEGEKRGNEGAMRDLGRRCKMLENALRGERSVLTLRRAGSKARVLTSGRACTDPSSSRPPTRSRPSRPQERRRPSRARPHLSRRRAHRQHHPPRRASRASSSCQHRRTWRRARRHRASPSRAPPPHSSSLLRLLSQCRAAERRRAWASTAGRAPGAGVQRPGATHEDARGVATTSSSASLTTVWR